MGLCVSVAFSCLKKNVKALSFFNDYLFYLLQALCHSFISLYLETFLLEKNIYTPLARECSSLHQKVYNYLKYLP